MSVIIPTIPTGSTLLAAMSCVMTFPRPLQSGIHNCPVVIGEEPTEQDTNLVECRVVPRNQPPPQNTMFLEGTNRSQNNLFFPLRGEIPIRNFRLARGKKANYARRRKHSIHQPGRTNCTQRYQPTM